MAFEKVTSTNSIQFDNSLTLKDIEKITEDRTVDNLQTRANKPIEEWIWEALNEKLFSKRPDIQLRIYGSYSTPYDLNFISKMGNVEYFSADCLREATSIESIITLKKLKGLGLGIYNLQDFDVLSKINPQIDQLSLNSTLSKKPDLKVLARFKNLKKLFLEGHVKGIETLSSLNQLENLTLLSITVPDLNFLRELRKLWSLDIKLGGTTNLSALFDLSNIKYLELWQIRGLSDISVISTLIGLQNLYLESLPLINSFPKTDKLKKLRRIMFMNMKGLHDFSELEHAPALEDLVFIDGLKQQPSELIPVLKNKNLKRAGGGFGSKQKNDAFKKILKSYHIEEKKSWTPFQFE